MYTTGIWTWSRRGACEKLPMPWGVSDYPDNCLGVVYSSIVEQLYNRIKQIEKYDWLTEEAVEACFVALKPHLLTNTIFEQSVEIQTPMFSEFGTVCLEGRMDVMNDDCIWEIKCVDTVTTEHFLQLVLYAWIWKSVRGSVHYISEQWGKRSRFSYEEFVVACRSYV